MIFVTGDCHGNFERFKPKYFPEQAQMTKRDIVICAGDFGGVWFGDGRDEAALDWLESLPFTLAFVCGNHENYDALERYPVKDWHGGKVHRIRSHVLHLMRGQVFELEGYHFFTMGGAKSHDTEDGILEPGAPDFERKLLMLQRKPRARYRINHISWWAQEMPSEEEYAEARKNLAKVDWAVDYVITHCAPTSIALMENRHNEADPLTDFLQEVKERAHYHYWLFGHYHDNRAIDEKHILLWEQIVQVMLTDRTDVVKPIGYDRSPSASMTDTDMKYIRLYLEENYDLTSEKKIMDAADLAAHQNSYHPVRDYLNSLTWDGTERIHYCLHHFLGAEADEYTFQALRLFLLGAIHRAFHPGCKFEVMLCLVGGQGAGKSTFFRLLAGKDEWFSDDLRKLDDENVYRKLQGHWIIEMSEMIATANAKSIEEIKSFLSRQKEVYKIPYETHPADRLRQCVFGGTSNAMDFLPLDRSGNRRFLPVQVCPEQAEVHILEDEAASRAYLRQVWAEAMTIYRAGGWKLTFSPEMVRYLKEHQKDFMPEDTKAGMIQAFLDSYTGDTVCSKQLYKEALNHAFDEPKQWEIREINEIMNQCVTGWTYFSNPRSFAGYGRQKGWEREKTATGSGNQNTEIPDGFVEITEQMELPF